MAAYLTCAMRFDILSESRPYRVVLGWLGTQGLPAQGHDWGFDPDTDWPVATFARFVVNDDLTGHVETFDFDGNGDRIPDGNGGYLTHNEPVTYTNLPPSQGTIA
ncbi:hypothetical protein [Streptosporangium saharense]|uniref:hypothetical protein n=1 Tax=Streptosporangium saharense TaxID=1706840 RepID=UPI003334902D